MKPMLAHKYNNQDVTGWWMSEKLDGVRAIWNANNFVSRTGKVFHAPDWFKESMPKYYLDGELWCGRGNFQETVGIVRSHKGNSDWESVQYMVFDHVDRNKLFERRLEILHNLKFPDHCQIVKQLRCRGQSHLEEYKSQILEMGGEGVMLREPESLYHFRRSRSLLKYKDMKYDIAVVTGYTEGKGKYEGMIGALLCQWWDGNWYRKITVGSGMTDEDRLSPPPTNTNIKIKYFDITESGMPRFPIYEGVLND
jgi:DNA ligase-1